MHFLVRPRPGVPIAFDFRMSGAKERLGLGGGSLRRRLAASILIGGGGGGGGARGRRPLPAAASVALTTADRRPLRRSLPRFTFKPTVSNPDRRK